MIGSKLAIEISKKNVDLILHGKSKQKLEELDQKINNSNKKSIFLNCNFQDENQIKKLSIAISHRFKKIDFIINAVGSIDKLCPLTDLTYKEWQKNLLVNLSANWMILKELEPLLKKSKNPKIFFFTNSEISNGKAFFNSYGVSKAALEAMVKMYSNEKKKFNFKVETIELENLKSGVFEKIYSDTNQINQAKELDKTIKKILKVIF